MTDIKIIREALKAGRSFTTYYSCDQKTIDLGIAALDRLSTQCPRGEKCDMTLAYMAGYAAEKVKPDSGMVLVPREPTEAKIKTLVNKMLNTKLGDGYGWSDYAADVYATVVNDAIPPDCADLGEGWLKIESAPKDENILVFDAMNEIQVEAWWSCYQWITCSGDISPTHWQPLPKPPSTQADGGE